jgi:LysM repeat protein
VDKIQALDNFYEIDGYSYPKESQGVAEMDKSEPGPGRDGNQQSPRDDRQSRGRDTGPRSGPDQYVKPITSKQMQDRALDKLTRAVKDSHKKKDVKEGEIEQTKTGIRHRGDRYGSGEELPNGGGNRSGFPNPGKYARDLDNLDKGLTSKLDHSMGVSWPKGRKKQDMDENINPLMKKLQAAMVKEGRVKELALDLKTLNDAEFMKKYGKAKAAIRASMKRVDEAGISRLGKKDIESEFDFRKGLVGDDETGYETQNEPELGMFRMGKPVEPNDAATKEFMAAFQSAGEQNADNSRQMEPGEFRTNDGRIFRFVTDPAAAPAKKEVQWIPSSEADSIASWKANNPGKSAADSAAASGLPKMRFDRASNSLVPVDSPPALDLSPKTKDKFDSQTRSVKPADGSGANPNIDVATRDRARAWAAQQNAPGAALAGAMRSTGTPVATAKNKTDWKTIYALNKATIGTNPNLIRPGMKLKMPDGSTYAVQPGDNLSKIAAKQSQINELSTEKLAQYKTAAAKDAKEADKAGDFKRGDKRFGGIVKATKKQFDNDDKKVDENRAARRALMARIVNS